MTITLPIGLKEKYLEACDFFLDNDMIGKNSTLIYPPKRIVCANCTVKMVGATKSNIYRNGGPAPYSFGNCPLCGGQGYKEVEVTDLIRLRIYWNRADWIRIAGSVNIADSEIMVIGRLSDLPKLRRAVEILLASDQKEAEYRATLVGQPYPHGFWRSYYFMAFLKGV